MIEKVFLAQLSAEALTAAVSATYASQIIQVPTIALAMMAQIFVGRWHGAQQWSMIGPGIWQFIWFCFLSMVITLPIAILYEEYYFQGTSVEEIALPYYRSLIGINFLFPLGAALSCFFLGRAKTRLILAATILCQAAKVVLSYLLIFGWEDLIPAFGLLGGAMSTAIAQGGYCLALLVVFLQPRYRQLYHSSTWGFKPALFWHCVQPGILRAMNRLLVMTSWAAIVRLMTTKGTDYSLILSIGGSLFFFLPFIGDAICQALTTIVSQMLGSQKHLELNQPFKSGISLLSFTILLSGVPFFQLPQETFHFLFPDIAMDSESIRMMLLGVWISFIFFTFAFIPISYVLAFKDTKFSLFMGIMSWITGYVFMYWAIEIYEIAPDQFWLVLSVNHAFNAFLYLWRMKWLTSSMLQTFNATPNAAPN